MYKHQKQEIDVTNILILRSFHLSFEPVESFLAKGAMLSYLLSFL